MLALLSLIFLWLQAVVVAGLPQALGSDPTPAAVAGQWSTKTKVWSTTQTSVTHLQWIAPTAVTMITTRTITTLIPGPIATYGALGGPFGCMARGT